MSVQFAAQDMRQGVCGPRTAQPAGWTSVSVSTGRVTWARMFLGPSPVGHGTQHSLGKHRPGLKDASRAESGAESVVSYLREVWARISALPLSRVSSLILLSPVFLIHQMGRVAPSHEWY